MAVVPLEGAPGRTHPFTSIGLHGPMSQCSTARAPAALQSDPASEGRVTSTNQLRREDKCLAAGLPPAARAAFLRACERGYLVEPRRGAPTPARRAWRMRCLGPRAPFVVLAKCQKLTAVSMDLLETHVRLTTNGISAAAEVLRQADARTFEVCPGFTDCLVHHDRAEEVAELLLAILRKPECVSDDETLGWIERQQ